MKKLALAVLCLGVVLGGTTSRAIDLKQSKLTQVVNDVQIISAAEQKLKAAAVNDVFSMPDILRTGSASRAELVAADETVTRVGANTIFSFDPANRTIDLKQGSLLFHAPHGKGGGAIHTGSATASVLGTTLIVTTTTNGGFKVIALEGQVEVKFLNGLKQKLDPGQMTFVLPGANQLAPVVIFRLDELTQNSLLVKGFAQPLQSQPLIQDQINHQQKLLRLGRLSETDLYVGDTAGPSQVEVLDINTITHGRQPQPQTPPSPPPPPPPPPPSLADAEGADATINQPSLTDVSIPTPPTHVFIDRTFSLDNNAYFSGMTFSGFVARNIAINTIGTGIGEVSPNVLAGGLSINLTPYGPHRVFDFVAVHNFSIDGSVSFDGLSSASTLWLIAGDQFSIAPGISIEADVKNFQFSTPADFLLDNVSLYNLNKNILIRSGRNISVLDNSFLNAAGNLALYAGSDISVADSHLMAKSSVFTSLNGSIGLQNSILDVPGHAIMIAPVAINLDNSTINSEYVTLSGTASASITMNDTTVNAASSIVASSPNSINITGTTGTGTETVSPRDVTGGSALVTDPSSGTVSLSSTFGSVNVQGTSISAHYLTLNSGDGILLDAYGHTLAATGAGATATFKAPNQITVRGADFSSFAALNMAANTIVLVDDVLAPISNFGTRTGLANLSGSVIPGELNLVNCFWQGQAVTSDLISYTQGPVNSVGIHSYSK